MASSSSLLYLISALVAGICFFTSSCIAVSYDEISSNYNLESQDASAPGNGIPLAKRHMLIPFPRMGKSVGPFGPSRPRYPYFLQRPYYIDQVAAVGDDESYDDAGPADVADLIPAFETGRKRSPYAPRLGKKRASPIAPRLGRPDPRSLYSPRIGKDLESSEKANFEQQALSNNGKHRIVGNNESGAGNDMEPRDLFIPRLG